MNWPGPKNSGPNPGSFRFLVRGTAPGWPSPGRNPGYVPGHHVQSGKSDRTLQMTGVICANQNMSYQCFIVTGSAVAVPPPRSARFVLT